jgi:hypothetical protein
VSASIGIRLGDPFGPPVAVKAGESDYANRREGTHMMETAEVVEVKNSEMPKKTGEIMRSLENNMKTGRNKFKNLLPVCETRSFLQGDGTR